MGVAVRMACLDALTHAIHGETAETLRRSGRGDAGA